MTDRRGQQDTEGLVSLIDRILLKTRTNMVGEVLAFDAADQTMTVRPLIRLAVTLDNVRTYLDMPEIFKAPLVTPYAQTLGFSLTLPLSVGDTVLLTVSDRAIDRWRESGGQQDHGQPFTPRHHDFTDALVIPGAIASPDAIEAYQTGAIEIRNRDRSSLVTLTDAHVVVRSGGSVVTVNADGTIIIDASTSVDINTPAATVTATATVDVVSPLMTFTGASDFQGPVTMAQTLGVAGATSTAAIVSSSTIAAPSITSNNIPFNSHEHGFIGEEEGQPGTTGGPQ